MRQSDIYSRGTRSRPRSRYAAAGGREQTRALDVAFGTHNRWSALTDSRPLIEASRSTFDELQRASFSFRRCIALAHLAHHIGKATGEIVARPDANARGHRGWIAGFYVRGGYMGKLRHPGSRTDLADEYDEIVSENDNAHAVEKWAFPSWVGDVPPNDDFELAEVVPLPRTADEILVEIDTYNETYVYYLAKTFLPIALREMDIRFGGKRAELARALRQRSESVVQQAVRAQLNETADLAGEAH